MWSSSSYSWIILELYCPEQFLLQSGNKMKYGRYFWLLFLILFPVFLVAEENLVAGNLLPGRTVSVVNINPVSGCRNFRFYQLHGETEIPLLQSHSLLGLAIPVGLAVHGSASDQHYRRNCKRNRYQLFHCILHESLQGFPWFI